MVNLGTIVVNSGSDGNIDNQNSTSILKDILKALQEQNRETKQTRKLSQSGLLSGVGAGALAKVGGVGGAALGGALAGFDASSSGDFINNARKLRGEDSSIFEQVTTASGEEFVLEINDKNQEVLRVLTRREAIEQGILDKTGKLQHKYETSNSTWDQINKDSAKIGDKVILAKSDIENYQKRINAIKLLTFERSVLIGDIKDLELGEKEIQKKINEVKLEILAKLRDQSRRAAEAEFFNNNTLTGAPNTGPLDPDFISDELEAFQNGQENEQFFLLNPSFRRNLPTESEINLPGPRIP